MGGGFGHLNRTIALARAALKKAEQANVELNVTIIANSPYALSNHVRKELGTSRLEYVAPNSTKPDACQQVQSTLNRHKPDLLVVDSFPRGLGGELVDWLPAFSGNRVLTHRDLNPDYVRTFDLANFVQQHYDLILLPGEGEQFAHLPNCFQTKPWLVRDASDLATRSDARKALGATANRPVVGVLRCGKESEATALEQLASTLATRLGERCDVVLLHPPGTSAADLVQSVSHWPVLEWHAGLDVLVGAGGYNSVYEARATGTPYIAIPQTRRYDRQSQRLLDRELASNAEDVVGKVATALQALDARSARNQPMSNGAMHAADKLIRWQAERSQSVLERDSSRWTSSSTQTAKRPNALELSPCGKEC